MSTLQRLTADLERLSQGIAQRDVELQQLTSHQAGAQQVAFHKLRLPPQN